MGAAGLEPHRGTPFLGGHHFKTSWPSLGPELVRATSWSGLPLGERRACLKPELEVVLTGQGVREPRPSCEDPDGAQVGKAEHPHCAGHLIRLVLLSRRAAPT